MGYDEQYDATHDQAVDYARGPAEGFVRVILEALGINGRTVGHIGFDKLAKEAANKVEDAMCSAVAEAVADELDGFGYDEGE